MNYFSPISAHIPKPIADAVEKMVNEEDESPNFDDIMRLVKAMDGTRPYKQPTSDQKLRGKSDGIRNFRIYICSFH